MAKDDRAVAEGSASWGLQGGMGLHLRGRGLQLSPDEESGDSIDVSRGRSVFAGPKMNPRGTPADAAKTLPESQNQWDRREPKLRSPFFRSLLGRHAVFGLRRASIVSSNPTPASPAWLVENSLPSSITGSLAHAAWKAGSESPELVMPGPASKRSKCATRIRSRASLTRLLDWTSYPARRNSSRK